jgi:adenylosuccinate lyase
MLALVGTGLARQSAYEIVQRNAMKAFRGEGSFRTLLGEDSEVAQRLSVDELDHCFDLEHALRWSNEIVDRALSA